MFQAISAGRNDFGNRKDCSKKVEEPERAFKPRRVVPKEFDELEWISEF